MSARRSAAAVEAGRDQLGRQDDRCPRYFEQSLALVRPGGLVVDERLLGDVRVDLSMLPMADGVTLARKRRPVV